LDAINLGAKLVMEAHSSPFPIELSFGARNGGGNTQWMPLRLLGK
jgi:hypothetical protein